jgi:hypothetical protein
LPSGAYTIDPDSIIGAIPQFSVYCDMITNGGGWTLVAGIFSDDTNWGYNSVKWTTNAVFGSAPANLSGNVDFKSTAFYNLPVSEFLFYQPANKLQGNLPATVTNFQSLFTQVPAAITISGVTGSLADATCSGCSYCSSCEYYWESNKLYINSGSSNQNMRIKIKRQGYGSSCYGDLYGGYGDQKWANLPECSGGTSSYYYALGYNTPTGIYILVR